MNVLGKFAKGVGDVVLGNDKSTQPYPCSIVTYLKVDMHDAKVDFLMYMTCTI